MKSLAAKLAEIRTNPASRSFILADDSPDFAKMTATERLAYHRARLNRQFGESPRVTHQK